MKNILLLAFIVCLTFSIGSSHDAYAEPGFNDNPSVCEIVNVPVTQYTIDNSSIVVEEPSLNEGELNSVRVRLQLALARICVSESGFQTSTNDCLLIYHVLRTRSRSGNITMGIMRAYAPRSFNLERTDNHRWVSHLRSDFREPRGWSDVVTISWSVRRDGWREVYEYAGWLLRSEPPNPCGIRVDHWGARYFRRNRHIRAGWIPIECGETRNQFWSLPSSSGGRNNL